MAKRDLSDYEKYWVHESESLRSEYGDIVQDFLDAKPVIKQADKVLQDIVCLVACTPASVGESEDWQRVVNNAQIDRESYCNVLKGKQFSTLYGLYTVTLNELKSVLQLSAPVPRQGLAISETPPAKAEKMNDGFREQRRRKRNSTEEETRVNSRKCTASTTLVAAHTYGKATPVATHNYFAPLRMEESQEEIDRSAELPVVLRKRSNASGAGGAAEAIILKWLYVRECPWYRRSGRESDASEVEAVKAIKYFDIFARIASFAAVAARSPAQGRKRQALESRLPRLLVLPRRTRQPIRSLRPRRSRRFFARPARLWSLT
jgi:hypothetical protein